MKKIIVHFFCLSACSAIGYAQLPGRAQDTTLNNLVHTPGYKTSEYGAIPQYVTSGEGKQTVILIPGYGFDASVFEDFTKANKSHYTMYTITIPGFGKTMAPPMPDTGTSYGLQTWNKGVNEGIVKLIRREKLQRPIIVGHFVQGTQLAIRLAIDYPDLVGGVIILGGPARFVGVSGGKVVEPALKDLVNYTDKFTGPKWFKKMEKRFFDSANFAPQIYSLDEKKGAALRQQVSEVPMPVIVRYSCEYFASDIKSEFNKIKCPVLVLRATFNKKILGNPLNGFIKLQFIDTWNDASTRNSLIQVQDIADAATFVWKDNPAETYSAIKNFQAYLFARQPVVQEDSIASYFDEVRAATKKNKKLWGKDLYGPILLVNPKTRELFANCPDSNGLLKKEGLLYKGYLPGEINIANYVIHWGGRKWSMILLNLLSSKKNERINLFSHELFHCAQPSLGFEFIEGDNKHLDKKEARVYLRLELEALKKALTSEEKGNVKKHLTDAFTFRKYRHLLFPGADTSENWLEINEGIAEYTGLIIDGRNKEDVISKLTQKINGFVTGEGSFVRSFAYRTVPVFGFLLHPSDTYWNKKVGVHTNLTNFFINGFALQIPKLTPTILDSIAAAYKGSSILAEETAREDKIQKLIADYKRKLTELPHLDIPCESMTMTANQGVQMPLEGWGTIYPSFLNASDKWGTLQVENGGVLIATGRTKISLPAPKQVETNLIKGSNWILKLNEGYRIEKDELSGNYRVVKQ